MRIAGAFIIPKKESEVKNGYFSNTCSAWNRCAAGQTGWAKTAFSKEIGNITAKLEAECDTNKESLKTARKALDEFKSMDVKDLQGKITALTDALQNKETEYQNKIADMEFNAALDGAISASQAKNAKALKTLLDVEKFRSSKNLTEDINAAIEAVKAENDFLFTSAEPIKNPVRETNGGLTREMFAKMGYADRLRRKKQIPQNMKK